MTLKRETIIALITGLNLLIHIDDAVPQACATMQTIDDVYHNLGSGATLNWSWAGAADSFDLDQDSNGRIAGTLSPPTCSLGDYYTTTGIINDSGAFSLSSTYHGNYLGCATTLNMSGKVSGAGCTAANGSWSNSSGLAGSFNMTHGCYFPTGETNQVFQGFVQRTNTNNGVTAVYEAAAFLMQLAPLSFNWGGRAVSETFPQPPQDGCWFPGSAVPQLVAIASKTVTVDSTGRYNDYIGPKVNDLTYYRQKGRTPCSITTQQVMTVDCPNPANQTYSTNTQIDTLGPLLLTVIRGNNPPVSEVFGAPAPALTLHAILFNILFPPH
jgi:hypothetical protein